MPTFSPGVAPVKLQTNFVPLYLPATISPGPDHDPSTEEKNFRSFSDAMAGAARPITVAAVAARTEEARRRAVIEQVPVDVAWLGEAWPRMVNDLHDEAVRSTMSQVRGRRKTIVAGLAFRVRGVSQKTQGWQ